MTQVPRRILVPRGGLRVDRLVAEATGGGRRAVRRWFEAGLVRSGHRCLRAADCPAEGDEIFLWPEQAAEEASPPVEQLPVLYLEAGCLVVAKPAGLHCERGRSPGCVADLLEARFGNLAAVGLRPAEAGLVHRLDRDTSGVLLAARTTDDYHRLRLAFSAALVLKQYLALVSGHLDRPREIHAPLARRASRMVVAGPHDRGLPASTQVEPLETGRDWSLVLATMATGVTHQVRVHLATSGHPLFGDGLYGGPPAPGGTRRGQLLHAVRLAVADEFDVTAPAPADFLAALAALRRRRG